MRLKNKTAIITGSGSGIGRACALLFAKEGAKVIVADWSFEGEKTAEEIRQNGGEAFFIKTDVSQSGDIDKMAALCLEKYGKIDILVNNAGIVKQSPFHETSEKDWDQVININLKSVFLGSKRVIPEMLKQGKGKIISVASIAGLVGFEQTGTYCASKGGIMALTRAMALEYAKNKININCIAPGVIDTAMTSGMLKDPATRQLFESSTPYFRLGEPDDIAFGALYLASEESDFVTGQVLTIDGGWTSK